MHIDQELLLDIYREISSMREFEELLQEETHRSSATEQTEQANFSQQGVTFTPFVDIVDSIK